MATPAGVVYDPTLQQYVTAPKVESQSFTWGGPTAQPASTVTAVEGEPAAAPPPPQPVAAPPPVPTVESTAYTIPVPTSAYKDAYHQLFEAPVDQYADAKTAYHQQVEAPAVAPYEREIGRETESAVTQQLAAELGQEDTSPTTAEGWATKYKTDYNNMVYGDGGLMQTAGTNAGAVLQGVSEYVLEQVKNASNDPMLKQQLDMFAIAAEASRSEIQAAASRINDPAAQAAMIAQGEMNIMDRFGRLMSQQSKEHRDYVLDLIQTATGTAGVELGQTQINEQSRQFYAKLSQDDVQYWNTLSQEGQQFIASLNQDQQQFLLTHGLQNQLAQDAMTRWNAELQWDKEKTAQINALDWQKFSAQFGLEKQEFALKLQQFAQDQANWASTFEFDQEKFAKTFGLSQKELEATLGIKMEELALNRLQVESQIENMDWDSLRGDIELLMEQENVDGAGLLTAQMIGARLYSPGTPEYEDFVANATQGYVVGLSGGTWAYLASKIKPGQTPPATISLMGNNYEIKTVGKSADGAYDLYANGQKIGTWDAATSTFVVDQDNPFVKNIETQDDLTSASEVNQFDNPDALATAKAKIDQGDYSILKGLSKTSPSYLTLLSAFPQFTPTSARLPVGTVVRMGYDLYKISNIGKSGAAFENLTSGGFYHMDASTGGQPAPGYVLYG